MSNPKFGINEAVMVRDPDGQVSNVDFTIVLEIEDCRSGNWGANDNSARAASEYYYQLSHVGEWYAESILRPIPKEKPNGICANQYIKDLIGETVT